MSSRRPPEELDIKPLVINKSRLLSTLRHCSSSDEVGSLIMRGFYRRWGVAVAIQRPRASGRHGGSFSAGFESCREPFEVLRNEDVA